MRHHREQLEFQFAEFLAMTINLNTDEYEGGDLWFPEYGTQRYRPAAGEAIIFSCSLLHEVTPMLQGRRFALLSFFYDDEAAQIRERNQQYLASHRTAASDRSSDMAPDIETDIELALDGSQDAEKDINRSTGEDVAMGVDIETAMGADLDLAIHINLDTNLDAKIRDGSNPRG